MVIGIPCASVGWRTGGAVASFTDATHPTCRVPSARPVVRSDCTIRSGTRLDALPHAGRPMWLDIASWLCTLSTGAPTPLASVEMHYVGHVDWSFADQPSPRLRHVDGPQPAPDRRAGRRAPSTPSSRSARLAAGGWLGRHIHSFEEALYVLAGELTIEHRRARPSPPAGRLRAHAGRDLARPRERDGGAGPLVLGQHAAAARSGRGTARHVLPRGPLDLAALAARAARPPFGDPALRSVGHYDGTPPQAEALRVDGPGPWSRTGRDGHGDPRLQRDLGEDAGRPDVRAPTC